MIDHQELKQHVRNMRCFGYSGVMELHINPLQAKDSGLREGYVMRIRTDLPDLMSSVEVIYDESQEYGDMLLGALAH